MRKTQGAHILEYCYALNVTETGRGRKGETQLKQVKDVIGDGVGEETAGPFNRVVKSRVVKLFRL